MTGDELLLDFFLLFSEEGAERDDAVGRHDALVPMAVEEGSYVLLDPDVVLLGPAWVDLLSALVTRSSVSTSMSMSLSAVLVSDSGIIRDGALELEDACAGGIAGREEMACRGGAMGSSSSSLMTIMAVMSAGSARKLGLHWLP